MGRTSKKRTDNLREDCVIEALSIISAEGIEKLSLREVARRLGVSHQAPYKHYPSRDHLLAEVVRRAYEDFAKHLEARKKSGDPRADLRAMGQAYIRYAMSHPLEYRLMFNTALPDPAHHPLMMACAHRAFDLLREALKVKSPDLAATRARDLDHDALFIWSTLHGLVSIMRSEVAAGLQVKANNAAAIEVLERIGTGIDNRS